MLFESPSPSVSLVVELWFLKEISLRWKRHLARAKIPRNSAKTIPRLESVLTNADPNLSGLDWMLRSFTDLEEGLSG